MNVAYVCHTEIETQEHLFHDCNAIKIFWEIIHAWLNAKFSHAIFVKEKT